MSTSCQVINQVLDEIGINAATTMASVPTPTPLPQRQEEKEDDLTARLNRLRKDE